MGTAPCALHFEVEEYVASTGVFVAWVKIPSLNTRAATSDTEIYIYYGNSTITSPLENPTGVWDSDYKGVWHLHDDFEDSTSNSNDGTNSGTTSATGNTADGRNFDGTDDVITTTSNELETADDFTISLWFKADDTAFAHHLLWQGESGGNGWGDSSNTHQEMHISLGDFPSTNAAGVSSNDRIAFNLGDNDETHDIDVLSVGTAFTDTTGFHHVMVTVTNLGTSPAVELFLDGVSVDSDTGTTTRTARDRWDTDLQFGEPGAATRYFDGVLDEVRISTIVRSDDWVATEFENYDDPAGVTTVGTAEADPTLSVKGITTDAFLRAGGVQLEWTTAGEIDNLGFHVYRERGGQQVRLTPSLIAGTALATGRTGPLHSRNRYSWFDPTGLPSDHYWVEDLDLRQGPTRHGPIVPAGQGPLLYANQAPTQSPRLAALAGGGRGGRTTSSGIRPMVRGRSASRGVTASASNFTATPPANGPRPWEVPGLTPEDLGSALAASPAWKIDVDGEAGWVRVEGQDLLAAGFDRATDPRNLQLYSLGIEHALRVVGGADGSIDPGDAIEFFGEGLDTPWSGTRVYWLVVGTRPGVSIPTPTITPASPPSSGAPERSYRETETRRERLFHFPTLRNGDAENFFGAIVSDVGVDVPVTLSAIDRDPQGTACLTVRLQGVTLVDHQVRVELDGVLLGVLSSFGHESSTGSFEISLLDLIDGENVVRLVSEGGSADFSFVDSISFEYSRHFRAEGGTLLSSAAGGTIVVIEDLPTPAIEVFDVTDPRRPRELSSSVLPGGPGVYTSEVVVPPGGTRQLFARVTGAVRGPRAITTNEPSGWSVGGQEGAVVILTHEEFRSSAARLATHRERQGWSVAVIEVEDLFDERNFGHPDPHAVKAFFREAEASWGVPPRFVVLLGDASLDPRGYLGGSERDFIPTYTVATERLETASDNWFVDFDGDAVPDLAIGRLPVRDGAEADRLVEKIIADERRTLGPLGASLPPPSILLVADTNDGVFDFEARAKELLSQVPRSHAVHLLERGNDPTADLKLRLELASGPRIVTYVGHGGRETWGGGLLEISTAESLENRSALSLFLPLTCLNGYFHDANADCLAEALLRAKGGAIAVWASAGMTRESGQLEAAHELLRSLLGTPGVPIGEAVRAALEQVEDLDVRKTWNYLGDPLTPLGR